MRQKWIDFVTGLGLLLCVTGLLLKPSQAVASASDGIRLCLDVIVPSLLPFFILSALTVELGLAAYWGRKLEKVMRPVFNLSGACASAVVLGFVGGYPVGAKTAISVYEKGLCSREEAERMLAFCNNSGPAFILGAVGSGIFSNSRVGWLLYLTHALASITIGVLFRFYKCGRRSYDTRGLSTPTKVPRLSRAFTSSVTSSFFTVLNICAFVIFFTVVIRLLVVFGVIPSVASFLGIALKPLGIQPDSAERVLTGLIEVTSGLWSLQGSESQLVGRLSMAAFMLGWAGLSVHCQVLSFLTESGLPIGTYVLGKLLHGVLSSAYTFFLVRFFGITLPVSGYLAEQVTVLARLDFGNTLDVILKVTMVIVAALLLLTGLAELTRS